jgi:predicted  nucleic acid-binding Zn-ribbon protein
MTNDELAKKLDEKFAGIDEKFAGIDAKFAGIDEKFAALNEKFAGVDNRFSRIDEASTKMEKRFERLEQKMDDGFGASRVRDEELRGLITFGLEARDVLRDDMHRRFDAADQKHDEQIHLLKDVIRHHLTKP